MNLNLGAGDETKIQILLIDQRWYINNKHTQTFQLDSSMS